MSARQVPAQILLLISTAGDLNPAMKANISKQVAAHFVSRLKSGDRTSLVQYGRRVQTIQNWTEDRHATSQAIKTKLSSDSGANLAGALAEAVSRFAETPVGNRHLVLITDGVDDSSDSGEANLRLAQAVKELLTQSVTVHIVSYASMGRKDMWKSQPLFEITAQDRVCRAGRCVISCSQHSPLFPGSRQESEDGLRRRDNRSSDLADRFRGFDETIGA